MFFKSRRFFLIVLLLVIISLSLFTSCSHQGDLSSRRDYLLARVLDPEFGPSSMPELIGPQFQGEWALVTLSMTAMGLANDAFNNSAFEQKARVSIEKIVRLMLLPKIREFDTKLWKEDALSSLSSPKGHIGYLGHLNIALGCYAIMGGKDADLLLLHKDISHALSRKLEFNENLLLDTYPGEIYIPDNVVIASSLGMYDLSRGSTYVTLLARWVKYYEEALVDDLGGLVFGAKFDRTPEGKSRGSGIGWNSHYLPFISNSLATKQYEVAKTHFFHRYAFVNLLAVKEYAKNWSGSGDIDSGPVIFGASPAATGFMIAGARHASDKAVEEDLLSTASFFGLSIVSSRGKYYLFCPLVGDAILYAGRTATKWDRRFIKHAF